LEYLGAVALTPILAGSQEASGMWGLIAKITLLPGRRDEMVEILKESAADMPGCLSYVVAKDGQTGSNESTARESSPVAMNSRL